MTVSLWGGQREMPGREANSFISASISLSNSGLHRLLTWRCSRMAKGLAEWGFVQGLGSSTRGRRKLQKQVEDAH